MKRSRGQRLRLTSQGTSSKMARRRHDLEDVEVTSPTTTNIFLVETILRRLFKQIESLSMLKDLRKICQLWDKVDTEELEERAFQGRFKSINLTFFNEDLFSRKIKPIKASILEMRGFLDETSSNPRLIRSFTIIFPCSLAILNLYKFRWFYKDYSPTYLKLAIPHDFRFNQDQEGLLKELLRWAAPTLRGIVILGFSARESDLIPHRRSFPIQSFNFPYLRELSSENYGSISDGITHVFETIFTKENHPETPSLTSLRLPYIYPFDFLDLKTNPSRWATLTSLEIECSQNYHGCLNPFTNGLLSLARAGMRLKKLALTIGNEHLGDVLAPFRDLSEFFASQASSLEALKLTFKLYLKVSTEEEGQAKIQLPIFERLNTLSLELHTGVSYINNTNIITTNFFEFGSISQPFPALEFLNILGFSGSFDIFFWGSSEVEERMNLKRIHFSASAWRNVDDLYLDKYFGFVEAVAFPQGSLQNLGILGGLVDTIRVLHIIDVTSELDLSQFKGLRKVVIEEDDITPKFHFTLRMSKLIQQKGCYLGYFKKVAELGLDSIMFRGLEMVEGESYKEFAEAFPFRVEFEDKPMDWSDEDFIDD